MSEQFTPNYTPEQMLAMVAQTTFRGFTRQDWYAWAGCESANPLIGEFEHPGDEGRTSTIVIDGASLNVTDFQGDKYDEYGGRVYVLGAQA